MVEGLTLFGWTIIVIVAVAIITIYVGDNLK